MRGTLAGIGGQGSGIVLALAVVVCGVSAQAPLSIPAGSASIAGRVTDRESQRPLEHVIVQLSSAIPGQSLIAMTDPDGQYVFEAIAAGRYRVSAMHEGFVTHHYGQSATGSTLDEIVRVEAGEARRLADLSLQRGGSIAGRITNSLGQPLKDVAVNALSFAEPGVYRTQALPRSNARGEYAVDALPAGTYYIAAQWTESDNREANAPPSRGVVFHPNVTALAEATPVRLGVGETVRNVDVVIHRPQRYQLAGHFVRSGNCPIQAHLLSKGNSIRSITVSADGVFEIAGLDLGVYTIWARCHGDGATEVAVMTMQVDSDVAELILTLRTPGRLTGRVVTADGAPLPEGPLYLAAQIAAGGQEIDPLPRDRVEIAADGSFDLPGVLGERKLTVTGLDPTWIIDHVRVGRSPVTSVSIQPGGEVHEITVVLGRR